MIRKLSIVFSLFLAIGIFAPVGMAQTTGFIYQGSLNSGGVVANGIFAVSLDFGSQFPGAQRFLEIRVRPTGGGAFTPLVPRQLINSAPYSVKSLSADTAANATNATNAVNATTATNATQLGGVAANQYVITTDARMSDARNPLPGNFNYIQNQSVLPQPGAFFNIGGTGLANQFDAATQYNIGGSRVLSIAGDNNIFAGASAGGVNTTGFLNAFFGSSAGRFNLAGARNSFFGTAAGGNNTTGSQNSFFGNAAGFNSKSDANSFFGNAAGFSNTTGSFNSFFGQDAGFSNTTGGDNAFFGRVAGYNNTGSSNAFFGSFAGEANRGPCCNSFFGSEAGRSTTFGGFNSFFGSEAGQANTTGASNTIIGTKANVGSGALNFATALGADAIVSTSNTVVLGRNLDTVQVPGNLNVNGTLNATLPGN